MIFALFGPPGSGKGTQAAMLAERLGCTHIATGNLLREAVAQGTPVGLQVRDILASGALVGDDLVRQILADALRDADAKGKSSVVLDGFPRTLVQIDMLRDVLEALGRTLSVVVFMRVSDAMIEERLTGRFSCADCSAGYHRRYHPPQVENVCDRCGGTRFVCRDDDGPEVVRRRLQVYRAETEPVLDAYRAQGLVRDVDAQGEPEAVFARISKVLAEVGGVTAEISGEPSGDAVGKIPVAQ